MNALRWVATALLLLVTVMALLGWRWAGGLPPPKQDGARLVLVLTAISSVAGAAYIWRIRSAGSS